jgi:O-antigen/teichoic acid export membrane protein
MSGVERTALLDPAPPESGSAGGSEAAVAAGSAAHDHAIVSGVMWQGALRWLSQALSWTATIVIARRLSPEDYGLAGTATVMVGLLSLLTEAGLGRALVMRRDRDERVVRQAHGAAILIGVASALLMLILAVPLARFYSEPRVTWVVAALSLALIFSGMNAIPLAVLQQQLHYRRLAAIDFCKAIAQAGTVLVGALLGLRHWSLVLGLIVGHFAAMMMTRRYIRLIANRPSRADLAPTLEYAQHLVLSALAWYLYSNSDFAVVGRVVGLSALGYYQFAWNVAQLPGEKLGNVLQSVVGPFFGAIGDDKRALRHYFLVLSELLVSIMLPVLFGFALVSPIAVPLIFGAKWSASVPVMQILVLCSALSSISLLSHHVLSASGQAIVATRLNLAALVVMPLGFYVAAKFYGPLAVAAVWLLAQPVLMGVPLLRMRQTIDLPVSSYLRSLRAPIVCSFLMAGVVLVLAQVIRGVAPIVQLLALSATGAAIYVVSFRLLFRARINAIVSLWKDRA